MQHSQGFLDLVNETRPRVDEVTVEEARARVAADPSVSLVDVREDGEWASGHATGAIHLGKGVIERDIEQTIPDRNANIILYCGGGYRSILAADALQHMGYRHVSSLAGGWRAWRDAGAPVTA